MIKLSIISFRNIFLSGFILLIGLFSCNKAPVFPLTPSIKHEGIRFVDIENNSDSLIVSIYFEDGDGDLGFFDNEDNTPYQSFNYIKDNGDYIRIGDNDSLPLYDCNDYSIEDVNEDNLLDTVLIIRNKYHNNFFVDFYIKTDTGYTYFNWKDFLPPGECQESFNGRFPYINPSNTSRALSGTIHYTMKSVGFIPLFHDDSIKLRIHIVDRALNESNVVESPAFLLLDMQD